MMVGDNIYHQQVGNNSWIQEDSHHSNQDGSCNFGNLLRDTGSTNVLVSEHFYYFGKCALPVNLTSIGYKNGVGHSKKLLSDKAVASFINKIEQQHKNEINLVLSDPCNFLAASKRVDQATRKIL